MRSAQAFLLLPINLSFLEPISLNFSQFERIPESLAPHPFALIFVKGWETSNPESQTT